MPYQHMRSYPFAIHVTLLLFLGLPLTINVAVARQLPDVAPPVWSANSWTGADDAVQGVRIGVRRTVPLRSLLPQAAPGSHIHVLVLEGGVQSDDGDVIGRFRIGGIDLGVQRGHRSVVLTLADYDRAGTMDLNATWARAGFGPGLSWNGPRRAGRIAVHAFSGLVTRQLGRTLYAPLPGNTTSNTMVEGGLSGRATFSHTAAWRVDARAEYTVHSQKGDLRTFMVEPELTWSPGARMRASVYAQWYGAERSGVEHDNTLIGVRLRLFR